MNLELPTIRSYTYTAGSAGRKNTYGSNAWQEVKTDGGMRIVSSMVRKTSRSTCRRFIESGEAPFLESAVLSRAPTALHSLLDNATRQTTNERMEPAVSRV